MSVSQQLILTNHGRIRDAVRRALEHTAGANHGELRAALALAGDLAELVKGLAIEEVLTSGDFSTRACSAVSAASANVSSAARSLSFVFSVRVVLECVVGVLRALDDIEEEQKARTDGRVAA